MEYTTYEISGRFFKLPSYYFLFRPIFLNYDKVYAAANKTGYTVKDKAILEKPASFGKGWISVLVDGPASKYTTDINETLKAVEHNGSYKDIGQTYKQIMTENPQANLFLNLYLNNPKQVSEQELKTIVLFK